MKKKITIGLLQMRCDRDPKTNLDNAIKRITRAADAGARLICLPELFLSPYFCQGRNKKHFALAETIPGPTTTVLGRLARDTKTTIIASLFEKSKSGKYYNSTAAIGPDGKILGTYRKLHLPSLPPGLYDEDFYFTRGNLGLPVWQTPEVTIAAPICYDQWFPEVARAVAVAGAQIIFYPTAIGWPQTDRGSLQRTEHQAWQTIQQSHAIANTVFVAAVNRVGREGQLRFWGTSFVSDPYGQIIAKVSSKKEENIIVTCDLSLINSMRRDWAFLDERQITCSL
ncbi:acyltransferase [Candidatus Falkowbacteria bacterium]|nr:acyltransferase [Candidatus Falkowbacteria bacterium]